LRDTTGWLALEGLYWLKEGRHPFGSSSDQTYVFPKDFPAYAGFFELNASGEMTISLKDPSFEVMVNEQLITTTTRLEPDYPGPPTLMRHYKWLFYPISRSEGKAIRLINTQSQKLKQFSGMEFFPIDPDWKIPARFEAFDTLKTLAVPTVLGSMRAEPWPGNLVFSYQGTTYKLAPTSNPADKEWFIVFSDQSNGNTTYGGGRFLYVQQPDSSGNTILDFNQAYSPPCLFSIHATCPLPPAVNRLPFEIPAGEKADLENH
ncbi:MAG: DUF1684 domain-containing protein, partial [Saprospiraceae bacterium]|nr:DUF1684 domain-containing protein [Saprospiraceae bacterium]